MNAKTMFGILTSLVMLAGTACGAADGTSAEADTSVQEDTLSAKTFWEGITLPMTALSG